MTTSNRGDWKMNKILFSRDLGRLELYLSDYDIKQLAKGAEIIMPVEINQHVNIDRIIFKRGF